MNKPRYSLDIVIAAPGTPLLDPDSGKQQRRPMALLILPGLATCSTFCTLQVKRRRVSASHPSSMAA